MKKTFTAAILLVLLPFISLQTAVAHPALFSHYTFADAKAKSKKEQKLLVLDFMASWCGPCNAMDETTWEDRHVSDWISENAIAIQLDVDQETEISEQYAVSAMPTILILDPKTGDVSDRHTGYMNASEIIAWFEKVKHGETKLASLQRMFAESSGKGIDKEVDARYNFAQWYLESGKFEQAAEQYAWLFPNRYKGGATHPSFIEDDMQACVIYYKPARARFLQLRDKENKSLEDWVALNRILGDSRKTLAWFDQNKDKRSFLENLSTENQTELAHLLLNSGRLKDLSVLYVDPVKAIRTRHELIEKFKKQLSEGKGADFRQLRGELSEMKELPEEAATIYGAFVAAGKDREASLLAGEILKLYDTAGMRYRLAEKWISAHQYVFWVFCTNFLKKNLMAVSIASVIVALSVAAAIISRRRGGAIPRP